MSLEQYIRMLLGDLEEELSIEIEPAFRFELPMPNQEGGADA